MDFDTIGNYIIFYAHAFKVGTMYLHRFFVDSFINTSKYSRYSSLMCSGDNRTPYLANQYMIFVSKDSLQLAQSSCLLTNLTRYICTYSMNRKFP